MDLHIAMLQRLKLMPSMHSATAQNSKLINIACQRLREVEAEVSGKDRQKTSTLQEKGDANSCITWRPTYVKDVFILSGNDKTQMMMGVMESNSFQFFKSHDSCVSTPPSSSIIFMGHVTCDSVDAGTDQMVILIYDMLTEEMLFKGDNTRERYNSLLQLRDVIEGQFYIGDSVCRLQWVGDETCYEKLCDLELPHEKACVVRLSDGAGYSIIKA